MLIATEHLLSLQAASFFYVFTEPGQLISYLYRMLGGKVGKNGENGPGRESSCACHLTAAPVLSAGPRAVRFLNDYMTGVPRIMACPDHDLVDIGDNSVLSGGHFCHNFSAGKFIFQPVTLGHSCTVHESGE
eukprot:SAG22_NODE_969_length_6231_cov_4.839041_4_plen_132_part_00